MEDRDGWRWRDMMRWVIVWRDSPGMGYSQFIVRATSSNSCSIARDWATWKTNEFIWLNIATIMVLQHIMWWKAISAIYVKKTVQWVQLFSPRLNQAAILYLIGCVNEINPATTFNKYNSWSYLVTSNGDWVAIEYDIMVYPTTTSRSYF